MRAVVSAVLALALAAFAGVALAQLRVHAQDDMRWVSGGITDDERGELIVMLPEHNLKLVTAAERSGAYLSDVGLVILDARGAKVVESRLDGPWFLARLPTGRYDLLLTYNGVTQKRVVTIPASGRRDGYFYWKDPSSADESVPEGSRRP